MKPGLYNSKEKESGVARVPKASELVSDYLRRQIVRGELLEGSLLAPENVLMERFNISRPTLREAVRILESEALIRITRGAHGGAVVQRPDVGVATRYLSLILQVNGTTLEEIYRVHALIEPLAARVVAESGNPQASVQLRACLAEGQEHFDNDLLYGTDTARFRNTLIELAGIPTLTLLMNVLNDIFERSWGKLTVHAKGGSDNRRVKQRGLKSMEKLIELIEQGDGDAAEAHWRTHTANVEKTMHTWMESRNIVDLLDE
jgi:DNA-binding FadR family transcriptional regulator